MYKGILTGLNGGTEAGCWRAQHLKYSAGPHHADTVELDLGTDHWPVISTICSKCPLLRSFPSVGTKNQNKQRQHKWQNVCWVYDRRVWSKGRERDTKCANGRDAPTREIRRGKKKKSVLDPQISINLTTVLIAGVRLNLTLQQNKHGSVS